jgi:hypothetical protein
MQPPPVRRGTIQSVLHNAAKLLPKKPTNTIIGAQDYAKAREWFEKAADKGEASATAYLENIISCPSGSSFVLDRANDRRECRSKLRGTLAFVTQRDGRFIESVSASTGRDASAACKA